MAIAFACPRCGKTFQVNESLAGKKARCKNCRALLLIPKPADPPIDVALRSIRGEHRPARSRASQPPDEVIGRARHEPAETEPAIRSRSPEREWRLPVDPPQLVGLLVILGSLASIAVAYVRGEGSPSGAAMRSNTIGIVGLIWLAWGGVWTIMTFLDSEDLSWFLLFRIPFLIVSSWLEELRAFALVAVGGFLVFTTGILQHFPGPGPGVPRDPQPPGAAQESGWTSWLPKPRRVGAAQPDSRFPPSRLDAGSLTPGPELESLPSTNRYPNQYPAGRLVEVGKESRRSRALGKETSRDVAPSGAVLVGVRVGYQTSMGGSKVGSVQPIYRLGDELIAGHRLGNQAGPQIEVVAKPGYAVGLLRLHVGLLVDGFDMVFMRIKDGSLDPEDVEVSPWLGDPVGGNYQEVSADGRIAIGLKVRHDDEDVQVIGLVVLAKRDPK